ncbi:hypothetical protein MXB_610, partial [Myxobolus squamalis]
DDYASIQENFILYIIYEISKYTLELIDFYHSYYEMIHSSILNINGQNITRKSNFYQMCKKSSVKLIISQWIENLNSNIFPTSNNDHHVNPSFSHFLSNLDEDFSHQMVLNPKSASFDGAYSNWESKKHLTSQIKNKGPKLLESNTIFRSLHSLKLNSSSQKFISTHLERGIAFSQTVFMSNKFNAKNHQTIVSYANFGSLESLTDFSQCLSELIMLIITNLFK